MKKRIPPGWTPDGTYQGLGFESPVCDFHCTTSTSKIQGQISNILRHGRENALTLSDLERVTGWNGRAIRRTVHRLRLDGVPVISDENGYYLPADASESRRFYDSMLHRAQEIAAVADAVRRAVGV